MTEYDKLMDDMGTTDDEIVILEIARKPAKHKLCKSIYIASALVFILTGSIMVRSNTMPAEPLTVSQLAITNLLDSSQIEDETVNLNSTEDTTYTKKVRINVKNILLNITNLMYQSNMDPVRPFLNMYDRYQALPKYNLSACMTPKAMATTLHGIFCYLELTEEFERRKKKLDKVYWNEPLCNYKVLPQPESTAKLIEYLPAEHVSFQVVRDPIKRFVSAFINKCIVEKETDPSHPTWKYCYDCNEDLECVVTKAQHDIMKRSRYDRLFHGPEDNKYFSEHFYPLTWQCDIAMRYDSIHFIRYVSGGKNKADMVNQLLSVMQMSGVENYKLKKISGVLLDDKPLTHATKGMSRTHTLLNKIYSSQKMLDSMISLYYYDYLVFEYPFPKLGEISEFD